MKQVKLFFVALMAIVMSMSVTSCLDGESNSIVPVVGVITLKNTFPYEFQVPQVNPDAKPNVTFVASKDLPNLMNATPGDIIFLNAQYDTETQQVDQNASKITIDVNYATRINKNAETGSYTKQEAKNLANRSVAVFDNYGAAPSMYTKDWLILPIPYYTEKLESFNLHDFTLAYLTDEEVTGTTLRLHLYHNSREEIKKETNLNIGYNAIETYKAFRIKRLIEAFKEKNGNVPQRIVVVVQESNNAVEVTEQNKNNYTEREYEVKDYSAK